MRNGIQQGNQPTQQATTLTSPVTALKSEGLAFFSFQAANTGLAEDSSILSAIVFVIVLVQLLALRLDVLLKLSQMNGALILANYTAK